MTRHILITALVATLAAWSGVAANYAPQAPAAAKPVVGEIAFTTEAETGMRFLARVDTGAKVCSIHAEELSVTDASEVMEENVGKTVRFRVHNRDGQTQWLERPIATVAYISNSNGAEWRYLVPMTLTLEGVEKEVLVSLKDRSTMNYALLLGRNLLAGEFVVDVQLGS